MGSTREAPEVAMRGLMNLAIFAFFAACALMIVASAYAARGYYPQ
jgi:hypothetical protein